MIDVPQKQKEGCPENIGQQSRADMSLYHSQAITGGAKRRPVHRQNTPNHVA